MESYQMLKCFYDDFMSVCKLCVVFQVALDEEYEKPRSEWRLPKLQMSSFEIIILQDDVSSDLCDTTDAATYLNTTNVPGKSERFERFISIALMKTTFYSVEFG